MSESCAHPVLPAAPLYDPITRQKLPHGPKANVRSTNKRPGKGKEDGKHHQKYLKPSQKAAPSPQHPEQGGGLWGLSLRRKEVVQGINGTQ